MKPNISKLSDRDDYNRMIVYQGYRNLDVVDKPSKIKTDASDLFQCNPDESIISSHIEESILIVTTTKRIVAIEVPE